jgi:hypothetical protein
LAAQVSFGAASRDRPSWLIEVWRAKRCCAAADILAFERGASFRRRARRAIALNNALATA